MTDQRVTLTDKQKLTWALAALANAADVRLNSEDPDDVCIDRITESLLARKSLEERVSAVEKELREARDAREKRSSSRPPPK